MRDEQLDDILGCLSWFGKQKAAELLVQHGITEEPEHIREALQARVYRGDYENAAKLAEILGKNRRTARLRRKAEQAKEYSERIKWHGYVVFQNRFLDWVARILAISDVKKHAFKEKDRLGHQIKAHLAYEKGDFFTMQSHFLDAGLPEKAVEYARKMYGENLEKADRSRLVNVIWACEIAAMYSDAARIAATIDAPYKRQTDAYRTLAEIFGQ